MTLSLHVPASVTTQFVIVTDSAHSDMARLAADLLPEDRRGTDPMLTTSAVQPLKASLEVRAGALTGELADAFAAIAANEYDDDVRGRLQTAPTLTVVEAETPTPSQATLAPALRALARELAAHTGGILVDPCSALVVRPIGGLGGERPWFCLADQWMKADCLIHDDRAANSDAAQLPPTQCACLAIFTRGLSRFGLPELFVDEVPCAYDLAAANVLRGLAVQLVSRLWAGGEEGSALRVEAATVVEPQHMWGYYGATPLFGLPVPVHLAESGGPGLPGDKGYLEVRPRPEFQGTRAEWMGQVVAEGLPSVAGWQPDDPPYLIAPTPPASS